MPNIATVTTDTVRRAYARWAPVYDMSFGVIAQAGRKSAAAIVNKKRGRVLELGVGTGISLPLYKDHLRVTAIDLSPEMLAIARARVEARGLTHVDEIHEMDAADLYFDDASFDVVLAMYVMTVVPDPEKVLRELERVCAPGGEVIIVNHFSEERGLRGRVERALAPMSAALGWRPEFSIEEILDRTELDLVERRALAPFGLFTLLRFRRPEMATGRAPRRDVADEAAGAASGALQPVTAQ